MRAMRAVAGWVVAWLGLAALTLLVAAASHAGMMMQR